MLKRSVIKYLAAVTGFMAGIYACKKNPDVTLPDFNVSATQTTVARGKPITFNFTGNAGSIVFWAGDSTRNYEFRKRDTVNGSPQLTFTSFRQHGVQDGLPDATLALLVSTNYNNGGTSTDVERATWIDITSRAMLSTAVAPATNQTNSGIIDLSDFKRVDSPMYLAFKYHDVPSPVPQRRWTIQNLSVDNVLPGNSRVNIRNVSNMVWSVLNITGSATWAVNTTQAAIGGTAANTPENIDWLISQPLFLNRVNPDMGISVKTNPTTIQTRYTFPGYPTPGTYTAVFLATNANRWDIKTVEKKITITVQ